MNSDNLVRKRIIIIILIFLLGLILTIGLFTMGENTNNKNIENKVKYEIITKDKNNFVLYVYGKQVDNIGENLENGKLEVKELKDIIIVAEYENDIIKNLYAINFNAEIIFEFNYNYSKNDKKFISILNSYDITEDTVKLNVKRNIDNVTDKWYCFVNDNEIIEYEVSYEYLGNNEFSKKNINNTKKMSEETNTEECYGEFRVNLDGGTTTQKYESKYKMGQTLELLEPTKDGYQFLGWEILSGNTELTDNILKFNGEPTLIKAKWLPNNYKITLDLDGGRLSNTSIIAIFDKTVKIDKPMKDGYEFVGWKISGDNINTNAQAGKTKNNLTIISNYDNNNFNYFKNLSTIQNAEINFKAIWKDNIKPKIKVKEYSTEWTNKNIFINYEMFDEGSLINSYMLSTDVNSNDWIYNSNNLKNITANNEILSNGLYYLIVKDNVGNITVNEINITNIDKENPVIKIDNSGGILKKDAYTNQEIEILYNVYDMGLSGVSKTEYSWSSSNVNEPNKWNEFDYTEELKFDFGCGIYYLWMKVKDKAGNENIITSNKFTIYGWQLENNTDWYYYDIDGTLLYGWQELHSKIETTELFKYYFDTSGVMQTGWQEIDGNWYYFNEEGAMQTGWQVISGNKYYFDDSGIMQTGLKTINGYRYYFNDAGVMQTGWVNYDGKNYYLSPTDYSDGGIGAAATGWHDIDNRKYHFDLDGVRQSGWQQIDGNWYYFDEEGIMQTGWLEESLGNWYYLGTDGVMQTGWIEVDGETYYLNSEGKMLALWQEIDGNWYYFDSNGKMQKGFIKLEEYTYYLNESGVLQKGFQEIANKKYYFNENGAMMTGLQKINNKSYYFNISTGVMETGWKTITGSKYYFNVTTGEALTNWQQMDGNWYYFDEEGVMQTGWLEESLGNWYYLGTDGVMQTGWIEVDGETYYLNSEGKMLALWQEIDGNWYFFDSNGKMQTGWIEVDGETYYLNSEGKMLALWQEIDGNWYYFDSNGKMQKGFQEIANKKYYFNENGAMMTGLQKINNKSYYFNISTGVVETGWKTITGSKYYFNVTTGEALTNWQEIDGSWYYFNEEGIMQLDWIRIGEYWYYLGTDGVMQKGWINIDGTWYYTNNDGVMLTGWTQIGEYWYYLGIDGKMQTGWVSDNGYWYYTNSDGIMITGWIQLEGIWYYLKPSGFTGWDGPRGSMLSNVTVTIDGTSYTFNSSGHCLNP